MNGLIAENYGWVSGNPELSHHYLLPTCVRLLKDHGVKSMLDIGTGNGATLPVWLGQGLRVAAMEPDNDGFLFSSKHDKADVRKLGVGDLLPAEWKNAFDAVVCLEVVEHLFDPVQLVETADQLLKEKGVVIISTPYHGYLKNLSLAVVNKWDFHHHPMRTGGHIKFWSRKTLSELFTSHGYYESSFHGVGRLPYLWKSMIMVFRKS